MIAHAWLTAIALVSASVPVTPGAGERALALYDQGAYLEAAEVAIGGYVSPAVPTGKRLQNARLAQEALAKAYETSSASGPRPEYLCRALDVLEATAPLLVEEEDARLHRVLAAVHHKTLAARHPGFVCEVGTELRPVLAVARGRVVAAPVVEVVPVPVAAVEVVPVDRRREASPAAMKLAGAVSLGLGVAALAVMGGGLGVRSQAARAATMLEAAREQQGGALTPAQAVELAPLSAADELGRRLTLAGGISGAVLVVLGATLVGRGHALARNRVTPVVGPGHAGLVLEGRF